MNQIKFTELLNQEIRRLISTEREHIGETSEEVHTMNLLFGSFFDKSKLTFEHREIMKSLQGLEVQTLLVDKFIDKPNECDDKVIRTVVGFVVLATMTERLSSAIKKLNLSKEKQIFVLDKWNETVKSIYIGEGLDVLYSGKKIKPLTLEEYLFIIKETTAKFIQLSIIFGALVSEKSEQEIRKIAQYGINLGIAFQLRDDYEDLENDILECKQRIAVIRESLNLLNENEKEFIITNYAKNPNECIKIIRNSKIPSYIKELNGQFIDKAIESINGLSGSYVNRLNEVAKILKI